jgi:hypothetical protein
LLAFVLSFAAVFLLLLFVAIREVWSAIPYEAPAAVYFAALGIGFMFFAFSLIQQFTLLLGYPTYSLEVTLFALLIFSGIGSVLSAGAAGKRNRTLLGLRCAVALMVLCHRFGLGPLVHRFEGATLAARVGVAAAVMAPLGLCLGAFMPIGLSDGFGRY